MNKKQPYSKRYDRWLLVYSRRGYLFYKNGGIRMSKTTRVNSKFDYFMEDMNCKYCLFWQRKSKYQKQGCNRAVCVCEEEKLDAVKHGRIKRERGWNKYQGWLARDGALEP